MIVTLSDSPYALVVVATPDEVHAFSVVVPDLPGCLASGDTFEEAIESAREAIAFQLTALRHSWPMAASPGALH